MIGLNYKEMIEMDNKFGDIVISVKDITVL